MLPLSCHDYHRCQPPNACQPSISLSATNLNVNHKLTVNYEVTVDLPRPHRPQETPIASAKIRVLMILPHLIPFHPHPPHALSCCIVSCIGSNSLSIAKLLSTFQDQTARKRRQSRGRRSDRLKMTRLHHLLSSPPLLILVMLYHILYLFRCRALPIFSFTGSGSGFVIDYRDTIVRRHTHCRPPLSLLITYLTVDHQSHC
ncbi:hypothetical protein JAAARDRAFT_623825 [Jaapia argillacea MUCL 33604]|uniref:Uncharacterized protein n=1 Tax=Jaapia argillacea MUCL 33604 TaxID=933084 RepID=A0A067Q7Q0_9AGAM|nr:hypothetical protein JAAARDRAFT_623825 [Jaapia argillacea MUCL 33604]